MKRVPKILILAIVGGLALAGCQAETDQYGSPGAIVSNNSIPDPLLFPLADAPPSALAFLGWSSLQVFLVIH